MLSPSGCAFTVIACRQNDRIEDYVSMLALIFLPMTAGLGAVGNVQDALGLLFYPGFHPSAFLWAQAVSGIYVAVPRQKCAAFLLTRS